MAIPELKVGDVLLVGKWKNRRAIIKGFSKDSNHQPLVHTDKGDFPVFHFRIEKLMDGESMNKAQQVLGLCESSFADRLKWEKHLGLCEDELETLLKELHYEQEQKDKLLKAGIPQGSDKIKVYTDRISKIHSKIKAIKDKQ